MAYQNPGSSLHLEPTKRKIYTYKEHANYFLRKLLEFYEAGEFCDIVLVAGNDDFKLGAHRMVLSASSGYFRAMFRSNLIDAQAKEVKLEQWDGEALKIIVDFMYMASIELCNATIENVLRAADFFQMHLLVDACCAFVTEQLAAYNCLGIVFFAEQHSYTELYEKSLSFACSNFEHVISEEEFLELNAEQLCRLLSSDDICVFSEKSVLRSVLSWIKHDEARREPLIINLLSHVRFPLLDARYIIENRKLLCRFPECHTLILDWLQYLLSPQSRVLFPQAVNRPRKPMKKLYFLNSDYKVQIYDPEGNQWTFLNWPHPPKKRTFFVSVGVDNKLVIAGGNGNVASNPECLNMHTMVWSTLPSMGSLQNVFAMVDLDGYLYAVGDRVTKFNFRTRSWTELPPMSAGLVNSNLQAVALEGLLYVVSGDTFECYDPLNNKWTRLSPKKVLPRKFGMGAVGGYLYIVGGRSSFTGEEIQAVERYDPKTCEWTKVCPMSVGCAIVAVTSWGNRLIVCGGHSKGKFVNLVEEYNPETDKWTPLASLIEYGDDCGHLLTI